MDLTNPDDMAMLEHVTAGPRGVFVLRMQHALTQSARVHIQQIWSEAWGGQEVPKIIVLEQGAELTVLNDAELRSIGLMRIGADKP